MAVIHQTTMRPAKLDLLAAWLPAQPWYVGTAQAPDLVRGRWFPARRPARRGGH